LIRRPLTPVYHRGHTHHSDQTKTPLAPVSQPSTRHRDSRIHLSTHQLEKAAPLCPYLKTDAGGTNGTNLTLFYRQIFLPSHRHQHGVEADQRPAYLQRSRWCATDYQRTQERSPISANSKKHIAGNESYFHILLFSYNIVNWFKGLCLPQEFQPMTFNSQCARFLLIPGELVHSGNRPVLKLPTQLRVSETLWSLPSRNVQA